MARQVIETIVSDLSGEQIPENEAWVMELTPPDGRQNKVRLDISREEAEAFVSKGTEVKRRGRRPGQTASATPRRANPSGNGRRRRRRQPGSDEG